MKIRILTRQQVEAEPWSVWNAFVDLLALEDYDDLSAEQRPAHLVFWYESEVQNGGHFQYFENKGVAHLDETITALALLGATGQEQVLREAGALWRGRSRPEIETVEEFCDEALEDEFGAFDARFHGCTPDLVQCLQTHLDQHQSAFIQIQ